MRTTLDINDNLLRDVMRVSKAKTKKDAVVIAIEEYLKSRRRQALRDMIGNYDDFALTLEDLEKMRREG